MPTITLTIDGKRITVEQGTTILQAALQHGIDIPFYCYHPALGVDGSCRVCIVRIERWPKLQTACSTVCTDGMVVDTRSPEVVEARAAVFEFLLINHPLDCPVCDKGGECPLQDYAYEFGPARSQMDFARRTFDGSGVKADVDFGPRLMLNRNRCILCTRCVRFMRDVAGDAQIAIIDRGNGSQIATFEERGVDSILSGNLVDVCPVGAITARDYRFRSRPWDNPVAVDTICTLCSKGCNTVAWLRAKPEWAKEPGLVRMTPRFAPEVNGYWMCDIGRFDFRWIDREDRLAQPLVRRDGDLRPAPWFDALAALRERALGSGTQALRSIRFLASAHASLEELFLIRTLAEQLGARATEAVAVAWRVTHKEQPPGTRFCVPVVDAPNVSGARDLGLSVPADASAGSDLGNLRADIETGRVPALYVFDPGPPGSLGDTGWLIDARRRNLLPLLVVHGTTLSVLAQAADIVLPAAAWLEKDGTYTNESGLVQGAARAVSPPGDTREDWQTLVRVAVTLGVPLPFTSARQVRADIADFMGGRSGYAHLASLAFGQPRRVLHALQTSNPSERAKWERLFRDSPPVKFEPAAEDQRS